MLEFYWILLMNVRPVPNVYPIYLDIYKKELGIRPSIVMVNEMAYSSGLVDVFL